MRLTVLWLSIALLSMVLWLRRDPSTPDVERAAPPPEGAVVQIGPSSYLPEPYYIFDDEIEAWVDTVSLVEPEESPRSWRRKALTNVNLPTTVAAALFPGERALARERAAALRELLLAEQPLPGDAPEPYEIAGHSAQLELALWGTAIRTPVGEWSELVEVPGAFMILRRTTPEPAEGWRGSSSIGAEILAVHFVPPSEVEALIEDSRAKLGVLPLEPPGWDGILPAHYEFE